MYNTRFLSKTKTPFFIHPHIYRPYRNIFISLIGMTPSSHTHMFQYIVPHLTFVLKAVLSPHVTPQKRACQMPRRDHHCHLCVPPSHVLSLMGLSPCPAGASCGSVWAAELCFKFGSVWAAEICFAFVPNSNSVPAERKPRQSL